MRKFITLLMLFLLIIIKSNARVITVNNTPGNPGMYANLQNACDSSNNGDTILVSGSQISYGIITLNHALTLLGTGFKPIKDLPYVSSVDFFSINHDNCDIEGFYINYSVYTPYGAVNNVKVSRNWIKKFAGNLNVVNSMVSNNYINISTVNNNIYIAGNNTIVENNIIQIVKGNTYTNTIEGGSAPSNFIFSNNTIIFNSTDIVSSNTFNFSLYNAWVNNNIFYYYCNSIWSSAVNNQGTYSIYDNNVVYNDTVSNPFGINTGNNSGSGNFYKTNPSFTNLVFDGSGNLDPIASNFLLQSNSLVKTGGSDGSEPGIYGGSIPFQNWPISGNPAIPQVSSMNINNVTVAPGDSINVNIKAKSFE